MEITREQIIMTPESSEYGTYNRILTDHGFSIVDYDQTTYFYTVKYNKCDSDLTFKMRGTTPGQRWYGSMSFYELYNGGIIFNSSLSNRSNSTVAYIAPETDEDIWVIAKGIHDAFSDIEIKIDENEGWFELINDFETYPTLNGIQLVNYFDFNKQMIFGNLYICKKLPSYRIMSRWYWTRTNQGDVDLRFPNTPFNLIGASQHWGNRMNTNTLSRYEGYSDNLFFSERIKIDNKIFIITPAFSWDYGTAFDDIYTKGALPVPLALRVT